jgi:hypothetical protein
MAEGEQIFLDPSSIAATEGGGDPWALGVGLGGDRMDGGDHHVDVRTQDPGHHIAHELDAAPLSGETEHHGFDGL